VKRLLLDQGLPRSTGALLSVSGWDIRHVSEIGMSRADDAAILEQGRSRASGQAMRPNVTDRLGRPEG
jgi:predicted nuclease of predicted toxin-antitoxin system